MTSRSRSLAVVLLVLVAGAGCGGHAAEEPAVASVAVRVVPVERRAFEDTVAAPGQWKSAGDVVVAAPFAAYVETLAPRVGDHVVQGRVIGSLLTHESRATLRGAELLLQEARSEPARAEAQRALALAKRELVRVPLLAPRTGVVSRRAVEPASEPAEGAELLSITPDGALVFEAHVPANARVHAGMRASIVEAGEAARPATVQRLLPLASATDQAMLVWLVPSGAGIAPAVDRFAAATLWLGERREGPAVPVGAIDEDDLTGEARVAVVGDSLRARWVPVKLGRAAAGWREVTDGPLEPGMRVIVEGQHGLPDGANVKIVR